MVKEYYLKAVTWDGEGGCVRMWFYTLVLLCYYACDSFLVLQAVVRVEIKLRGHSGSWNNNSSSRYFLILFGTCSFLGFSNFAHP